MPVTKGGVARGIKAFLFLTVETVKCQAGPALKSLEFEAVEYSQNATHVRLQSTLGHSRKWLRFKVDLLFCELVIYTHKYKRERFNKKTNAV